MHKKEMKKAGLNSNLGRCLGVSELISLGM